MEEKKITMISLVTASEKEPQAQVKNLNVWWRPSLAVIAKFKDVV